MVYNVGMFLSSAPCTVMPLCYIKEYDKILWWIRAVQTTSLSSFASCLQVVSFLMISTSADIQVFHRLKTSFSSPSCTSGYSHKLDGILKALLIISVVNSVFLHLRGPAFLPRPWVSPMSSTHFKSLGMSSEDSIESSHCKQLFCPWFFVRDFSRFILLNHESNISLSQWCLVLCEYATDPKLELNVDYSL